MSSNKYDDKFYKDLDIVVLDEISGSNKIEAVNLKSNSNKSFEKDFEIKVAKKNKKEKIIIPIEEFSQRMTSTEERAYREYKRQQFPELFEINDLENDKSSEVPSLSLTQSAKFFAALLEAKFRDDEKKKKNKIVH